MSPRLAFALEAAWKGAKSTLALYQTGADVETKSDLTPVTQADKRAEEIIRQEIERAFPGETVLGEEQGLDGHSDDRWVIDPIDGTKSFVAGVPLYSTLLSYEQDGQPILGVIVFPALNEAIYAEVGGGAFWNGRPCRVSSREKIDRGFFCHAGMKGVEQYGHAKGVIEISQRSMASRTWCDAYGHALVATGRVDAMFDPVVSRWDISAVIPIVAEAGGRTSRLDGVSALEPWHPGGGNQLLSSNGLVHEDLCRVLAS